jgi:hypothetical protein
MRAPDKRSGPDTTPGRSQKDSTTADEAKATVHAWRCWSWRTRHGCGCPAADDCLLITPLPVHAAQPCRGEFGGGGRWRPCCSQEAS